MLKPFRTAMLTLAAATALVINLAAPSVRAAEDNKKTCSCEAATPAPGYTCAEVASLFGLLAEIDDADIDTEEATMDDGTEVEHHWLRSADGRARVHAFVKDEDDPPAVWEKTGETVVTLADGSLVRRMELASPGRYGRGVIFLKITGPTEGDWDSGLQLPIKN